MRLVAVFLFGIVFPCVVLIQAYSSVCSLREDIKYTTKLDDLPKYVNNAHSTSWSTNDYLLFSLLYVEHANQKTMINKQVMKTSIVLIGFGVISVGMMLILLGIEVGGLNGVFGIGDIKFNVVTGSTGVGVFVLGAIVATLGGVLKNDYQTSSIPPFGSTPNLRNYNDSLSAYKSCNKQPDSVEQCFSQIFFQINKDELK